MNQIGLTPRLELALGVFCTFNVNGCATIPQSCLVDFVYELLDGLSTRAVRTRLDAFANAYYPGAMVFSAHAVLAALHFASFGEVSVSVACWNSLYGRAAQRALEAEQSKAQPTWYTT